MLRDTLAALDQLPQTSARFQTDPTRRAHPALAVLETTIRHSLPLVQAYNMVPGRDP